MNKNKKTILAIGLVAIATLAYILGKVSAKC